MCIRDRDWAEDIPEYYALQAALYAHLLGVDSVIMVASFLDLSLIHILSPFIDVSMAFAKQEPVDFQCVIPLYDYQEQAKACLLYTSRCV